MSHVARRIGLSLVLLSVVVLFQGCVSRARYKAMEALYNGAVAERDGLKDQLANLGQTDSRISNLIKEREGLLARIRKGDAALSAKHQDWAKEKAAVAMLDAQIKKLTAERDNLDARLQKALALAGDNKNLRTENQALLKKLAAMGLQGELVDGMVKLNLPSDLLFHSGSATLRGGMKTTLKSLGTILKTEAARVRIAGHTDNVPLKKVRKRFIDNWGLSCERALSVSRFLMGSGLRKETLYVAGYGEFKPLTDNKTAANRKKNRRVEVFIEPKKAS